MINLELKQAIQAICSIRKDNFASLSAHSGIKYSETFMLAYTHERSEAVKFYLELK